MLTLKVDVTKAVSWFDEIEEKQLPFAIAKSINATAKDVQLAEREHMHATFHLNREQWADRSVKITHFAKKTEQSATIAIAPPGSDAKPYKVDVFGKFEEDTEKTGFQGHAIVVPVDATRTKGGIISNTMRPSKLNLQPVTSRSDLRIYTGDRNTVLIQRPDGTGLVIQRTGPHRLGVLDGTVLFLLKPRVTIVPNLQFEPIGERVVDERFQERFDEAWALAMETAK